jgi:dynein heavy chain 1
MYPLISSPTFAHPCKAFAPANSSTAAAVTFITFVQDLKKKTKAWGPMIELCENGEKTLHRFRYQFPEDWLYSDQLRGEWSAYNEILKRKNDSIQEQLGARLAVLDVLF